MTIKAITATPATDKTTDIAVEGELGTCTAGKCPADAWVVKDASESTREAAIKAGDMVIPNLVLLQYSKDAHSDVTADFWELDSSKGKSCVAIMEEMGWDPEKTWYIAKLDSYDFEAGVKSINETDLKKDGFVAAYVLGKESETDEEKHAFWLLDKEGKRSEKLARGGGMGTCMLVGIIGGSIAALLALAVVLWYFVFRKTEPTDQVERVSSWTVPVGLLVAVLTSSAYVKFRNVERRDRSQTLEMNFLP